MKFYKDINTNKVYCENEIENKDNYILLKANTKDAAFEKHIPVVTKQDDELLVQVGEIEHPMTEDHYIMWVAQVYEDTIEKVELKPGEKPMTKFKYIKDSTIYAYCNLHGLWQTEKIV